MNPKTSALVSLAFIAVVAMLFSGVSASECPESHTTNPDGTCTAVFGDPTVDGYVISFSGTTYYKDTSAQYLSIGYNSIYMISTTRSFVEWDISSIPDDAKINSVSFRYHGSQHTNGCHIRDMSTRPSTGGTGTIYNDMGTGDIYADPAGFPVAAANQDVGLNEQAVSDLQDQLPSDWFAIGMRADNEGYSGWNWILSENTGATPKPTLVVNYRIDSCTPPENGDWVVEISDNCVITNDNVVDGKIIVTGSGGTLTFDQAEIDADGLEINATNYRIVFKSPFRFAVS